MRYRLTGPEKEEEGGGDHRPHCQEAQCRDLELRVAEQPLRHPQRHQQRGFERQGFLSLLVCPSASRALPESILIQDMIDVIEIHLLPK